MNRMFGSPYWRMQDVRKAGKQVIIHKSMFVETLKHSSTIVCASVREHRLAPFETCTFVQKPEE
jgi:hypothetical protein